MICTLTLSLPTKQVHTGADFHVFDELMRHPTANCPAGSVVPAVALTLLQTSLQLFDGDIVRVGWRSPAWLSNVRNVLAAHVVTLASFSRPLPPWSSPPAWWFRGLWFGWTCLESAILFFSDWHPLLGFDPLDVFLESRDSDYSASGCTWLSFKGTCMLTFRLRSVSAVSVPANRTNSSQSRL